MKLLLLTNKPPWPPHDGGAKATLSVIKGLYGCGVSITVLYMNTEKHHTPVDQIPEDYLKMAEFNSVDVDTSVKKRNVLKNLLFSKEPFNLQRFRSADYEKKLADLLALDFDFIQCEGLPLCLYYDTIRTYSKARIVLRAHNAENKIWEDLSSNEKNIFKKIYFRILAGRLKYFETHYVNIYDAIVTLSPIDLLWFRKAGLTIPSIAIPSGIETSLISAPTVKNKNKIGYIGSLEWYPNLLAITWFIEKVWPVVLLKIPDSTLHIAGRNNKKQFSELFTGKNIHYYGEVSDSADFIDDKTVMISPLFAGSGIRIKIIEAMSRGKAVIATPAAVEGIEVCHGENILVADSPVAFAENLISLLENESLRERLGRNAIETVRSKYDIFVTANQLVKFYSTLIS